MATGPRPVSVTVLAVLGIVFSALGICGMGMQLAGAMGLNFGPNPLQEELGKDAAYSVYMGIMQVINGLLIALLLASSCGSLKLRPWARKGLLIESGISLALLAVGVVLSLVWIQPYVMGPAIDRAAPRLAPAAVDMTRLMTNWIWVLVVPLGAIYPLCVLHFFRKENVREAFRGIFPASPTFFEVIPGVAEKTEQR